MKSNMSELTKTLRPALARLSKQEERQSIKAVTSYLSAEIKPGGPPRFRVLGVELRIEKPSRPKAVPQRLTRVLVADYGNKRNLDILVDRAGKIIRADNYRGFQPAFHLEEINEARKIAESDSRIANLTKRREWFVSSFVPEETVTGTSRHIGLRYTLARKGQGVSLLASVSVDLCEQKITSFEAGEIVR